MALEGGVVPEHEFKSFPKIDAHVHYDTLSLAFAEQAQSDGFVSLVSLCADIALKGWPYIEEQHRICKTLQSRISKTPSCDKVKLHWACSFHVDDFNEEDFSRRTVEWVRDRMDHDGALSVKFWKNIGMELQNKEGKFVFIDDAKFHPLFQYLIERGATMACHCGEPRNCWLPVDQMTVNNDAEYFACNPKYHMHLHPEYPSYESQVDARDRVLEAFPQLTVVGAHLGSLEWSVGELSKRLEKYPQFAVDFAHRMCHLQTQAQSRRDDVIAFFVRFQDQLVYGTDLMFFKDEDDDEQIKKKAHEVWESDWLFLATTKTLSCPEVRGEYQGLGLGRTILEKVYFKNAVARYR
eukprot:PhF_6_TR28275/c0_g1_i1/m.41840